MSPATSFESHAGSSFLQATSFVCLYRDRKGSNYSFKESVNPQTVSSVTRGYTLTNLKPDKERLHHYASLLRMIKRVPLSQHRIHVSYLSLRTNTLTILQTYCVDVFIMIFIQYTPVYHDLSFCKSFHRLSSVSECTCGLIAPVLQHHPEPTPVPQPSFFPTLHYTHCGPTT